MKLTENCIKCGKIKKLHVKLDDWSPCNKAYRYIYKCGHTERFEINLDSLRLISNLSGSKSAYDFQQTGIQFVNDTNYNALIADGMGLGKTIQALLSWRNLYEAIKPRLLLLKSATTFQWIRVFK